MVKRPPTTKFLTLLATCVLLVPAPTLAETFSGDYVYTLLKNKIVRTMGGKSVSFLQPNTSGPNATSESRNPAQSRPDRGDQPTVSEKLAAEFSRNSQAQAEQMVADSFKKNDGNAYTPEFAERTLLYGNEEMIRENNATVARVQKRLSQLQGSSPSVTAERASLQEQVNLLRARESQLRDEAQRIRN